jgi:glycosyltransferase involved in cell wall biosynthesis
VIAAKMREESERRCFEAEIEPLLNPIRWPEPFGMVMIEALACGTPVISFPEGAAPEIITPGRDGFLGDTDEALTQAVGRLHQIDRDACRRTVLQRFSTVHMTQNRLDL